MSRGHKIGLGLAVGAVALGGLHYGYWWVSTNEIKKQLAIYAANVQALPGNRFTYEATAAGYPFAQRVDLSNISVHSHMEKKDADFALDIPAGVSIHAGNGLTDSHLRMTAKDMPFVLRLRDAKPGKEPFSMELLGKLGDADMRGPLVWRKDIEQSVTTQAHMLEMWSANDASAKIVVPEIIQTATFTPEGNGSMTSHVEMKRIAATTSKTEGGKKLPGDLVIGNAMVDMAMEQISSTVPVLKHLDIKISNIASNDPMLDKATGKIVMSHTMVNNVAMGVGMTPHEELMDLAFNFRVEDMKVSGGTGVELMPNTRMIACTMNYQNLPKDLSGTVTENRSNDARVGVLVDLAIKNHMKIVLENCGVDSDSLKATLAGEWAVTPEGYPSISLHLAGSGKAAVTLNAMRGAEPTDTMDISVTTVSNTLMLDGKPFFPLPNIKQLMAQPVPVAPMAPAPAVQ